MFVFLSIILSILLIFTVLCFYLTQESYRKTGIWFESTPKDARFVIASGRKIHYKMTGQGNYTVVLIGAAGMPLDEMSKIHDELSLLNRVISYERPGIGYSETTIGKRTSDVIIKEIKAILDNERILNNIILVGFEIGALYATHYAKYFKEQVTGMVLLSPITQDYKDWSLNFVEYKEVFSFEKIINKKLRMSSMGLLRFKQYDKYYKDAVNPEVLKEIMAHPRTYISMQREYIGIEESVSKFRIKKGELKIPIKIIYPIEDTLHKEFELISKKLKGYEIKSMIDFYEAQIKAMAELSTDSELITVLTTSKNMHRERVDTILIEVNEIKKNSNEVYREEINSLTEII